MRQHWSRRSVTVEMNGTLHKLRIGDTLLVTTNVTTEAEDGSIGTADGYIIVRMPVKVVDIR